VDYLLRNNLGETIDLGDRVAVIGGGNVAMDAVRTALRNGSKQPFLIYRRSEAEMPASAEEIEECREEGIEIMTLTNPVRVIESDGTITAIECIRMQLGEPDASGRRRPEPVPGSEFTIDVDAVVPAIGQESDWACLTDECACTLNDWGTMIVNPVTLQTEDADIFAGGDAVSGPATVVEAIAAGKTAAESIRRFLSDEEVEADRERSMNPVEDVDLSTAVAMERQSMPMADPDGRKASFDEVQLGFDEAAVQKEVQRCLACGVCSECYQCVSACLADAVCHDMTEQIHEVNVGAVILAPGFAPFDPSLYETYSYASHPNVVTSLEFERILSASGPFEGHLVRPSDRREPKKIAWLQCVGSRDLNACDNGYCSSVCCMYANKQAVIAKEHSDVELDAAIFFMDLRTFGKDFDKYAIRAHMDHGVRHVRSRIHSVFPSEDDRLRIVYATEAGKSVDELFDMVVLSIGLAPNPDAVALAGRLGVNLNHYNHAQTDCLAPVSTNREGIFVCGAFQEPKDIPLSVMEASASAAAATRLLVDSRWTLTRKRELPPELDVSEQGPRIGVFVCNCGINIGGIADVPAVRDYAADLPHVVHVEDNLFTCSQDSQDHMKAIITRKRHQPGGGGLLLPAHPRTPVPGDHPGCRPEQVSVRDGQHPRPEHLGAHERTGAGHRKGQGPGPHGRGQGRPHRTPAPGEPGNQQDRPGGRRRCGRHGGGPGCGRPGMQRGAGRKIHRTGRRGQPAERHLAGGAHRPYLAETIDRVNAHPRIELLTGTRVKTTGGSIGNFSTTAGFDPERQQIGNGRCPRGHHPGHRRR
jgi:heterodisulfide reductase subunit A-like polyferredoxin